MADVYRDGILYNTSKAIKNGQEYLFDWTMLNEYNSLQNYMNGAQADLKTSIENKGITVPSSATLDQYYLYVNQISAAARGLATGITTYANTIVAGAQYGMRSGPFVSWNDSNGNLYGVCSYCELTSSSEYYSFCGFSKVGTSDIQYYHPSEQSGSYSYNPVTEHLRVFKNGDVVRIFFTTWSTRDIACAFAGEWNLANNSTSVSCIGGVSSYDPSDWGYDLTGWDEIVDSTWVQDITTERQDSTGKMYLTLKLDSIWESYVYACQADLKTAIENKGVTVPSSATLDEYASYVDQIQTGVPVEIYDLFMPQSFVLTNQFFNRNMSVAVSADICDVAKPDGSVYYHYFWYRDAQTTAYDAWRVGAFIKTPNANPTFAYSNYLSEERYYNHHVFLNVRQRGKYDGNNVKMSTLSVREHYSYDYGTSGGDYDYDFYAVNIENSTFSLVYLGNVSTGQWAQDYTTSPIPAEIDTAWTTSCGMGENETLTPVGATSMSIISGTESRYYSLVATLNTFN